MALAPPVALLTLLLGVAAPALAEPVQPGEPARHLTPSDARGRTLALPIPGRTTLLTFAGTSNAEAVGAISSALRVEAPELEIVSVIDLSGTPSLLRGFMRSQIVSREATAVEESLRAFERAGRPAPADLADRVFVVPDFEARCFERYGMEDGAERPRMVLVDAEGVVRSVFEVRSLERAREALAGAGVLPLAPVAAAPPSPAALAVD